MKLVLAGLIMTLAFSAQAQMPQGEPVNFSCVCGVNVDTASKSIKIEHTDGKGPASGFVDMGIDAQGKLLDGSIRCTAGEMGMDEMGVRKLFMSIGQHHLNTYPAFQSVKSDWSKMLNPGEQRMVKVPGLGFIQCFGLVEEVLD